MIDNPRSSLPVKSRVSLGSMLKTALLMCLSPALALSQTEIVITPGTGGWMPANVRADTTISITTTQDRPGTVSSQGDSAIEFVTQFMTAGQDKADYQLIWQTSMGSIDFPFRTLPNLTALSYEYFRDSGSAVGPVLHPVLRLVWLHDSNTPADPLDDTFGSFIFEAVYQPGFPGSVTTDNWVSNDLLNAEFWVFCSDCDPGAGVASGVVQNFDLTLADWLTGPQMGAGGDPVPPDFSVGTTYVVGINTGVGSGWNADLQMYSDNVRIAFGAGDDLLYNFEDNPLVSLAPVTVPILNPAGLAVLVLLIALLASLALRRRHD